MEKPSYLIPGKLYSNTDPNGVRYTEIRAGVIHYHSLCHNQIVLFVSQEKEKLCVKYNFLYNGRIIFFRLYFSAVEVANKILKGFLTIYE